MGVARPATGRSRRWAARSVMSARRVLSVAAVRMWCMGEHAPWHRIGASVVAGPPSGVRIRTRIHVTGAEAAALGAVGSFLGGVYRAELAQRVRLGVLDRQGAAGGGGGGEGGGR